MNYSLLHSVLRQHISENSKVLDVGCGSKIYSIYGKTTTLDAWQNVDPDYLINLETQDLPFQDASFQFLVVYDFIQHITKDRGYQLLQEFKRVCTDKIFLFTPANWDDNSINVNNPACWAYDNKFDYHKSLWAMQDFKGWKLITPSDTAIFVQWDCKK